MGEVRVDADTGQWRLIAPGRAIRPDDRSGGQVSCPFCPGNEAMTPPEVMRVPVGDPAWRIRVVPNLFSLTAPADGRAEPPRPEDGFLFTGRHEVVVESRQHDWDLRWAGPQEAAEILGAVRERCRALAAGRPAAVVVFRNHGRAAGTSLAHPHSQIVALNQAPPALVDRWRRARDHFVHTGRCLHLDTVTAERRGGERIVVDTGDVLVFQPRAAAGPYEMTLVPTDGGADLASTRDDVLAAVARILPGVLRALAAVAGDPDYNLVVHGAPVDVEGASAWFRWHLSVQPRVTTLGGLELATGLLVNPSAPEQTAPILRRAFSRGSDDPMP